ncbi:MAG: type II toxin-antitoxin system VapC family toxin [Chloroflexota bacterium]
MPNRTLTLDTSGILAGLNRRDPNHQEALTALREGNGWFVIPTGIMAEVTYMIEARLGPDVLDTFLSDLETGAFTLDCGEADLPRIRELIDRYADLPLGYADAAVVACAERRGGRVLSYDIRHFQGVAREGIIHLVSSET